jgi:hypothetical protein
MNNNNNNNNNNKNKRDEKEWWMEVRNTQSTVMTTLINQTHSHTCEHNLIFYLIHRWIRMPRTPTRELSIQQSDVDWIGWNRIMKMIENEATERKKTKKNKKKTKQVYTNRDIPYQ